MSTIMDLTVLSSVGASAELCKELMGMGCELKASKEEAVVYNSGDKSHLFRVTSEGVDKALMESLFQKNTSLQKWVGDCRKVAHDIHGNAKVTKEYDAKEGLISFRGENGSVRVQVEKRHQTEGKKVEKHAAYTPSVSVNGDLYRLCRIAMEQFKGATSSDKDNGPSMIQVAPELRWSEKQKAHVLTAIKEETKKWSDKIAYKEQKIEQKVEQKQEQVKCEGHKHHKHHHHHS